MPDRIAQIRERWTPELSSGGCEQACATDVAYLLGEVERLTKLTNDYDQINHDLLRENESLMTTKRVLQIVAAEAGWRTVYVRDGVRTIHAVAAWKLVLNQDDEGEYTTIEGWDPNGPGCEESDHFVGYLEPGEDDERGMLRLGWRQ